MPQVPITDLILDYTLYPRHRVDDTNVRKLVLALEAGATLPPIIADRATKRVADGFHRHAAYKRVQGAEARVPVEWRTYPDAGALFLDAVRLNANHGRRLAPYDEALCIQRAEELHLEPEQLAAALSLTVARVEEVRLRKTAISPTAHLMPIKATAAHLAQEQLTARQVTGNEQAGGMRSLFYVNQVANLLENDLVDWQNPRLVEGLRCLARLLDEVLAAHAA
jgi:hypothetical protein